MDSMPTLVCFAVKEETKFFKAATCRILITGMGQKNAAENLRQALASARPGLVLTCGFAGGLNPSLAVGDVVFEADDERRAGEKLIAAGAFRAKFHCAEQVAVTAADKRALRESTGADAVEMESGVIRAICREMNIPAATVRVISDAANEELPLDFNALMTADDRMNYAKLAGKLMRAPLKIPHADEISEANRFRRPRNLASRPGKITGSGRAVEGCAAGRGGFSSSTFSEYVINPAPSMMSSTPPQRSSETSSCKMSLAAIVVSTKPSAVSGHTKLTVPWDIRKSRVPKKIASNKHAQQDIGGWSRRF